MITSYSFSTLPVTRWKNGKGETREIIRVASGDADFLWRASMATLQEDGPFSLFPDVDRVLVLVDGSPLWIHGEGIEHHLQPGVPWAFAGEWPLATKGISAPGLDFNVMTQRKRVVAQPRVITTPCLPAKDGVAYVLSGCWRLNGESHGVKSGIVWQNESPRLLRPESADAQLLLVEITPVQSAG